MTRRLAALLTAVCLIISFYISFSAAEEEEITYVENEWNFVEGSMDVSGGIPENAGGVLARIRENGKLRVATEPYFPPQEFIDPDLEGDEQYIGSDIEMAKYIAEKMGVELEIVPMDFTEVLTAVAEDRCDLAISALAYTPSRAATNELSKGYFYAEGNTKTGLIIRGEDAETIRSTADLADKRILAQSGSLQEAIAAENVQNYLEFRRIASAQSIYDMVIRRKSDAAFVDIETAEAYIHNNPGSGLVMVEGVVFSLEPQYEGDRIAGKKGELELMYFVNGIIDELLESGQYMKWIEEARKRAEELEL